MAQETEIQKCCCSEEHVHHCGGDVTDAGSHEFILWSWIKAAIESAKTAITTAISTAKTEVIGYFEGVGSAISTAKTAIIGSDSDTKDSKTIAGVHKHIDASKDKIVGTNSLSTLTEVRNDVATLSEKILEDEDYGIPSVKTNIAEVKGLLPVGYAKKTDIPTDYAKKTDIPTDYAKQGDDSSVSLTGVYEAVGGDKWDEGSLSLYELTGSISSKIDNNTYGLAAIKAAIPSASSIKSGLATSTELENVHIGLADKVNTVIEKVDAIKAVVDAIKAKVDTL